MKTFNEAWAEMEDRGYRYGADALEQVRLGWNMRGDAMNAESAVAREALAQRDKENFDKGHDHAIERIYVSLRGTGPCCVINMPDPTKDILQWTILDAPPEPRKVSAPQWRNISPGEYDDTMECTHCGFKYMHSADVSPTENTRRSGHKCKGQRT